MKKNGTKALRFTHIYLENWKNFTKVDIDLQSRTLLVGPNASGKSNLLDAFRFLHDIVSMGGGFQESIEKREGIAKIRCLAARKTPDIVIHVHVGDDDSPAMWEYELRFSQDQRKKPIIKKERVVCSGKDLLNRPVKDDHDDPEQLTQTYMEQVNVNKAYRELSELFSSVSYLHVVPQLIRDPDRSIGRKNDPFGGDFLEQIAKTSEKTRNAWLNKIRNALRVAVPQLEELQLTHEKGKGSPHLRGKYGHWRPQGAWQTEEQFSDGTIRLIGLLWSMLRGRGPLLLEEPELSLHPEIIRYLPQMFARIQQNKRQQVIISTHSADLLHDEGIGLDEVLLLLPTNEGTKVEAAGKIKDAVTLLNSGLTLADVVIPKTRPLNVEQLSFFDGE